ACQYLIWRYIVFLRAFSARLLRATTAGCNTQPDARITTSSWIRNGAWL
ncbi:MAG: hypothetical protein ACI8PT_004943, partial [Gammaproteobacteria bacterium]